MTERKSTIIIGLLFAGLLVGTGIMQTHLKNNPQLFMLIFGGLTLTSFITKQNIITTWLFYILIGTMLYINYFMLTNLIIDLVNPDRGWVEFEGERHRVMDMSWIWGVILGFILSPLTIILYHREKVRNRSIEIGVTSLFLALTTVIYIVYELR